MRMEPVIHEMAAKSGIPLPSTSPIATGPPPMLPNVLGVKVWAWTAVAASATIANEQTNSAKRELGVCMRGIFPAAEVGRHPLIRGWLEVQAVALVCLCARRNDRIWRTASGIRSFGSFHGNMLTSAFGASIADSIATLYGCAGMSSGRISTGVWQLRTKSRVTVITKSGLLRYILVRNLSTVAIVTSGWRLTKSGPQPDMFVS